MNSQFHPGLLKTHNYKQNLAIYKYIILVHTVFSFLLQNLIMFERSLNNTKTLNCSKTNSWEILICMWKTFPSSHALCLRRFFFNNFYWSMVDFILSVLWWMRIRGLWKLPDGRDWLWGKLGLALVGRVMLFKSVIQLSADRWGYAASLLIDWPEATQSWNLQAL